MAEPTVDPTVTNIEENADALLDAPEGAPDKSTHPPGFSSM